MQTTTPDAPNPDQKPTEPETPAEFARWLQDVQTDLFTNPPERLTPEVIKAGAVTEIKARLAETVRLCKWAPYTRPIQHAKINRLLDELTMPVRQWQTGRPQASYVLETV